MVSGIKKTVRVIAFLAIFLLLFIHVSYILRPYAGSASRKNICGFYAEDEKSLDVVFVGSSSVFSFWEPMRFWEKYGVTSYNYATGTLPPQLITWEIREIQKTQDPALYVIDLRPFTVAETGYYQQREIPNMEYEVPLRNSLDNMKYSVGRIRAINDTVPASEDKLTYYIDLLRYHTEWMRLKDHESLSYWRNETLDYTKGFKMVEQYSPINHTDRSQITKRKEVSERLTDELEEILKFCRQEDLQVLFLVNAYDESKKDRRRYNFMADMIESYGYLYLNTNDYWEEIGLDADTDYYDHSHTNILGADKYTDFVGAYLMEHFALPVQSDERICEKWDRDLIKWNESAGTLRKMIWEKIENGEAG